MFNAIFWAVGTGVSDAILHYVLPTETVTCRMLILGRGIGCGCRCATSWGDLDLIFDLVEMPLTVKIFSDFVE